MKVKLILAALMVATFASAQVQWGLRAGLNLSHLSDDDKYDYWYADIDDETIEHKSKPGLSIGVSAYVPTNNFFGIETGLYFQQLGERIEGKKYEKDERYDEEWGYEEKYKIKLNYLQVPILASYKLPVNVDWKLQAGPYLAVAVSGKAKGEADRSYPDYKYNSKKGKYEEVDVTKHDEGEQKIFDDDVINRFVREEDWTAKYESHRFDFGWQLGTTLTRNKFVFGVHYQLGMVSVAKLSNIHDRGFTEDWKLKNRCLHISFGINF